ncbi:Putative ribonuclease H protein At1g65750 [Linum perenne]
MAKLAFAFLQKPNELWVRVLQAKYFREIGGEFRLRNLASQSGVWKGISKAWGVMLEGARSGIGNGRETPFWTGKWIDSGKKLIDQVVFNPDQLDISARVRDLVAADGEWDHRDEDTWVWGCENNGKFSIRSAYDIITCPVNPRPDTAWDLVWRWSGPCRIQHFLWLVAHEKILTNLERSRRHLSDSVNFPRCSTTAEFVLHVVRDCSFASQVWDLMELSRSEAIRNEQNVDSWLKEVLKHPRSLDIGILCWYLWKARNELIFKQVIQTPQSIAAKTSVWSNTVKAALGDTRGQVVIPTRRNADICWEPGPPSWHILNSDGSVIPQSGSAAAGGVVRDESGRAVAAYSVNLGRCSITRAELRGILVGLDVVWDIRIRKVAVQVDSKVAISLISEPGEPCHHHAGEVVAIRKLLQRDWEVTISHVYREGNKIADYLASIGHGLPPGTHPISISDCNLGFYLRYGCMGISEPRIIHS